MASPRAIGSAGEALLRLAVAIIGQLRQYKERIFMRCRAISANNRRQTRDEAFSRFVRMAFASARCCRAVAVACAASGVKYRYLPAVSLHQALSSAVIGGREWQGGYCRACVEQNVCRETTKRLARPLADHSHAGRQLCRSRSPGCASPRAREPKGIARSTRFPVRCIESRTEPTQHWIDWQL